MAFVQRQVKSSDRRPFPLSTLRTGSNSFGNFQCCPQAIPVVTSTEAQGIAALTLQFLFATIAYAGRPKARDRAGFYVRAELPNCSGKPKNLFLGDAALRRYFYLLDSDTRQRSLYALLGVAEMATPGDLRLAWRLRSLELDAAGSQARDRAQIERAFNVLAHPELRS